MKTMLKFNPCHRVCPLYRGWPLLGGSVMGSSTVHINQLMLYVLYLSIIYYTHLIT